VFTFGTTPNHTPLKCRCMMKRSNKIRHATLLELTASQSLWHGAGIMMTRLLRINRDSGTVLVSPCVKGAYPLHIHWPYSDHQVTQFVNYQSEFDQIEIMALHTRAWGPVIIGIYNLPLVENAKTVPLHFTLESQALRDKGSVKGWTTLHDHYIR
jgi:hypothetical protein